MESIGTGGYRLFEARPFDSAKIIPGSESVSAGRGFLDIEEFLAARCPCCSAAESNTRHERLCHGSGAQVNQHEPLVHALSCTFKSMPFCHQVESGTIFRANMDFRLDVVIQAGGLQDDTTSECRNKAISLHVACVRGPIGGGTHAGRQR